MRALQAAGGLSASLAKVAHAADPGIGFSSRVTAGAQHRIAIRRRRRIAAISALSVAAAAAMALVVTHQAERPGVAFAMPALDKYMPAVAPTRHDPWKPREVDPDVRALVHLANVDRAAPLLRQLGAHREAPAAVQGRARRERAMSRMRTLFAIVLPSMLAGGVLFGSAFSRADAGLEVGFGPDNPATVVAQASPPAPPSPPSPARPARPARVIVVPPVPPVPPVPGIPVDVSKMVGDQIQQAIDQVRNNPQIPANIRDKVIKRLERVRAKTAKRLEHLDLNNPGQLGEEMGQLGEEIGEEMSQFGDDMNQWGEQFGEQLGKQIENQMTHSFGPHGSGNNGMHIHINQGNHASHDGDDDDDDDDDSSASTSTAADSASDDGDDDNSDDDAVVELGDLSLQQPQRNQIEQLRANSQRQVAAARQQLQQASAALRHALDDVDASDAELAHAIDVVSQQEATIRKARILAWHDARRVLDDVQRKKVQDAAARAKPRTK